MNLNEIMILISVLILIIFILFIDLGLFNRKSHVLKFKEAIIWSIIWISLGVMFYLALLARGELLHGINNQEQLKEFILKYHNNLNPDKLSFEENINLYRHNLALEFITAYFIEYSLSADNLFVILMIFLSFGLREKFYKRILFWGILGAIVTRFIFIFISSALIQNFEWIMYIFGSLLLFTGGKMLLTKKRDESVNINNHVIVKLSSKIFNTFPRMIGQRFYVFKKGKFMFTPLIVVLLVVEFSDIVFAVDSVPAVFAATRDPIIVFFSNVFAIIGLRSLFFVIVNALNKFRYLNKGISILLIFVGFKMLAGKLFDNAGFSNGFTLLIIFIILAVTIILSILKKQDSKIS